MSGTPKSLVVHQVRKLADLAKPGQQPRPDWMTIMAKKRRKTLVVCDACHDLIHEHASTLTA